MKILKKTKEKNNSSFKFEYQDKIIFQGIYFDLEQKDDKEYVNRIERIITKKIPKIKKDLIEK